MTLDEKNAEAGRKAPSAGEAQVALKSIPGIQSTRELPTDENALKLELIGSLTSDLRAEIFRLAIPHAHVAVVTEIDADFEGDVHAPELGPGWRETGRERHRSPAGIAYSFVTYER